MHFGMGRISLWAELRYWVRALTPFIRRRFGLVHTLFLPPSVPPPPPWAKACLGNGCIVYWSGYDFPVASRGWFDPSYIAVKRLVIMMALFRFSRPFRLLLLISLETFIVSHFSTSSAGLDVSLISAQNCLWCFLSFCLPRGRFPCFPP